MPVYQFAIKRDNVQDPDVRWTHLSDDEAARRSPTPCQRVRIERALCSFVAFSSGGEGRQRRGVALDPNPTIWVRGDLNARSGPPPLLDGLMRPMIACVTEAPRQSELADMNVAARQQHDRNSRARVGINWTSPHSASEVFDALGPSSARRQTPKNKRGTQCRHFFQRWLEYRVFLFGHSCANRCFWHPRPLR
jgi:hypothetical protein